MVDTTGNITTDLYVKPTDKHQHLDFRSCHPRGCKKGISYAQALRLRRICSSVELFDKRAADLVGFLVARGFDEGLVRQQIRRARKVTRDGAFTPFPDRKKNSRVPFIVTCHPGSPNMGGILLDLHPLLQTSARRL